METEPQKALVDAGTDHVAAGPWLRSMNLVDVMSKAGDVSQTRFRGGDEIGGASRMAPKRLAPKRPEQEHSSRMLHTTAIARRPTAGPPRSRRRNTHGCGPG